MRYCEVVEEAKKRFPNSPSRQNDFVAGWFRQPKTGSYTGYGRSQSQNKKLRIR